MSVKIFPKLNGIANISCYIMIWFLKFVYFIGIIMVDRQFFYLGHALGAQLLDCIFPLVTMVERICSKAF